MAAESPTAWAPPPTAPLRAWARFLVSRTSLGHSKKPSPTIPSGVSPSTHPKVLYHVSPLLASVRPVTIRNSLAYLFEVVTSGESNSRWTKPCPSPCLPWPSAAPGSEAVLSHRFRGGLPALLGDSSTAGEETGEGKVLSKGQAMQPWGGCHL